MTYLVESKYHRVLGILLIFLFSIKPVFALTISEIVANPTGSDTGCEMIEIYNEEDVDYDISSLELYDAGALRQLAVGSGDSKILAKEYVLFLQNSSALLNCKVSFSGKYFISNFQLANTKDSLSLKIKGGAELDNFKFDKDGIEGVKIEAKEGKSLSKIDGVIKETEITLGTQNSLNSSNQSNNNTSTTTATTSDVVSGFVSPIYYNRYYFPESEKIYLNAGENRIGVVGADIVFDVRAVNGDKKSVNANFFWSFGDGSDAEGNIVSHTYKYPGEYTVDVEGYANGNKNSARIYIKIIDPKLNIQLGKKDGSEYVEIFNKSGEELDIGGYYINSSKLPKKLSILPNKSIKIPFENIKLATNTTKVSLNFANGKELTGYEYIFTGAGKVQSATQSEQATTSVVSVFTKEEFEKQKNKPENKQSQPANIKRTSQKKIQNSGTTNKTNSVEPEVFTNEKFVVKSENNSLLKNILNYFGI